MVRLWQTWYESAQKRMKKALCPVIGNGGPSDTVRGGAWEKSNVKAIGTRESWLGNSQNRTVDVMSTKYSPLAAANSFLSEFAGVQGIEHMKLQKLVYCAHGWWLTAYPVSFLDERPQIWKHGPVFNSLYHILKPFGRMPINSPQSSGPFEPPVFIGDTDVISLIKWVWSRYGHLTSFALSDMTHRPGTAWSRVAAERNFSVPHGLEIPDEYVREEFTRQHALDPVEGDDDGRGSSAA